MKIIIPSQLAIHLGHPIYALQLSKNKGTYSLKKKKILLLLQHNDNDIQALAYAINIARAIDGEIVVTTVFSNVSEPDNEDNYIKELSKLWHDHFWNFFSLKKQFIETFEPESKTINVKFIYEFRNGNLLEEVLKITKTHPIEFIVSTYHLYADKINNYLNSASVNQLLESTRTPILLIPEKCSYTTIKNIAYATDFQKFEQSNQIANRMFHLSELLNAHIHFLHITEKNNLVEVEDIKLFNHLLDTTHKNEKHSLEVIDGSSSPLDVLKEYSTNSNIDLIVVIHQHRNLLQGLFHESFTEQISFFTEKPILLFSS